MLDHDAVDTSKDATQWKMTLAWLLSTFVLVANFCPVTAWLGASTAHHRTFDPPGPLQVESFHDGAGHSLVGFRSGPRARHALKDAYRDALPATFGSLRLQLTGTRFDEVDEIGPWLANRLPAPWSIASEEVSAGWLGCCARAHVVLVRATPAPEPTPFTSPTSSPTEPPGR